MPPPVVSDLLSELKSLLRVDFPQLSSTLKPPASIDSIRSVEEIIGRTWPEDLRLLYQLHDGESEYGGFFFGLPFLSTEDLLAAWREWQPFYENDDDNFDVNIISVPDSAIKENYANRFYLPICKDFAGNHLGIDLDPGDAGTFGQVINFGRDEDTRYVIASSITEFLQFMLAHVRSKNYQVDLEEQGPMWKLKDPANNHFLDTLKDLELPFGLMRTSTNQTDFSSWIDELPSEWKAVIADCCPSSANFDRLAAVTSLNLLERNVPSVEPLAQFSHLRKLILSGNPVRDISPLKHLKLLKKLFVGYTKIEEIEAIGGLTNLVSLSLNSLTLDSLSALMPLKRLKSLCLDYCTITDWSALFELTGLTELSLQFADLQSFDSLGELSNLRQLNLGDTDVADLAFLSKLPKLTTLQLYGTQVVDFSVLAELPKLSTVTCEFADFLELKDKLGKNVDFAICGDMTNSQREIFYAWARS